MTRTLAGPTIPARFYTCPAGCPECATHPGHQEAAYQLGRDLAAARPVTDPQTEAARIDADLPGLSRLAAPFAAGIRDAYLTTVGDVVTAATHFAAVVVAALIALAWATAAGTTALAVCAAVVAAAAGVGGWVAAHRPDTPGASTTIHPAEREGGPVTGHAG